MRFSDLYLAPTFSTASLIKSATRSGAASIAKWPVGTVIVVAFILAASVASSSGEMVRSLDAMTNQAGLFFHDGFVAGAPRAAPAVGPCVANKIIFST